MLVEKYRPRSLDEIVGQKRIVKIHKGFIKEQEFPNILYVGKQGTGKTAMAYAFRYELGCKDASSFLELNASDESTEYREGQESLCIDLDTRSRRLN